MPKPKVSILVAAYNVEQWLEECLLSVRKQSFENFECIVVDDCSTDGTPGIISSFAAADKRFKLIQHPVNKGLVQARKTGFLNASGEYVWYVDGDDIVTADGLEPLVKIMDRDKCDIGRGRFQSLENGTLSDKNFTKTTPAFSNRSFQQLYRHMPPISIWLNIFRKSFLDECDVPFYPELNLGEDMVYCSYAFSRARHISISDHPIYVYRVRSDSYTNVNKATRRYLEEANCHRVGFEHLINIPIVALDFVYRYSSYRMRWVSDACQNLPAEKAHEVVSAYKTIYQGGFDQLGHSIAHKNHAMGWTPEKNKDVFLFGMLMKHENPRSIVDYYRSLA